MSKAKILLALGASAILAGCNPAPAAKTAAADVPALPAPTLPFSVNELMVMIVDQPGELLWDAEKKGHAPKTDEDWYQLENHAVSLAAAGTMIQFGGTGPKDADWAKQASWRANAQQLVVAAQAARLAAHAKDLPGLIKANGQIVDACEACHKEFKPDIPTGKMFIHLRPASAGSS